MVLHHAYLIKGWLLDKDPPQPVNEALEAIIGAQRSPVAIELRYRDSDVQVVPLTHRDASEQPAAETAPPPAPGQKKPRQGSGWSAERRAEASERMKARQASGGLRRKSQEPSPGEAQASPHSEASDATGTGTGTATW